MGGGFGSPGDGGDMPKVPSLLLCCDLFRILFYGNKLAWQLVERFSAVLLQNL